METMNQELQNLRHELIEKNSSSPVLDQLIRDLEILCYQIDPFLELTNEEKVKLSKLGIPANLNPYQLTNTLVYLLEESILKRQSLSLTENHKLIESLPN